MSKRSSYRRQRRARRRRSGVRHVIESDVEIVVDRTMFWDDRQLRLVGGDEPAVAVAHVVSRGGRDRRQLLPVLPAAESEPDRDVRRCAFATCGLTGPPVERLYTVGPRTRLTIQVDDVPGLEDDDVSGVIESTEQRAGHRRAGDVHPRSDQPRRSASSPGMRAPASPRCRRSGSSPRVPPARSSICTSCSPTPTRSRRSCG